MKKKTILPLLFCLSFATQTSAQSDICSTQLELGGGLGSANPWTFGFKGEYGSRLKLMPMLRVNSINRHSSGETEDMNYTFTGIMPLSQNAGSAFQSHGQRHSYGYGLDYGLSARYLLDQHSTLTASIKGNVLHTDNEGNLYEQAFAAGQLLTPYNQVSSLLDGYTHNHSMEVTAGYRYAAPKPYAIHEGFGLDYSYSRAAEDLSSKQTIMDAGSAPGITPFSDFSHSDLRMDGLSQKHRVQGTWMGHASTVRLEMAAFYENRLLTSQDRQHFEGLNNPARGLASYDEHFSHRYNMGGLYAQAGTKVGPVALRARLEYDYTSMEGHHLNDLLPMGSAEWEVNKNNKLAVNYVRRLVRPTLDLLNPAHISTTYTCNYGEKDLIGMHINNLTLGHTLRLNKLTLNSTLLHIFVNDGFNALWMERAGIRNYTWGNEGKRRAWSLTEKATVTPVEGTTINAQASAIWDKRIAEAIHMANEHWGFGAQLGVEQRVTKTTVLTAQGHFAEGNTVDLYSHQGRSYGAGASVRQTLGKGLQLSLTYDYNQYAKLKITQGAYTGTLYNRLAKKHAATLNLTYKF